METTTTDGKGDVRMDLNGNSLKNGQAGRHFAVLWILFAALAMQFVLSAQAFSAWSSATRNAGSFSVPEGAPSDQTLSRQAMRSAPVADLRFAADRPDGKPFPGGTGPFVLPVAAYTLPVLHAHPVVTPFGLSVQANAVGHHTRVRAPPAVSA
ncbi:hypothetical protein [Pararhizobium antarcticum]|uniref:Uncharacterized protein n=1 Tax=Pararhizobium antarcticum TaxID=1798805 RepID=A0A657LXZ4_9HYPH|nr:hypothetical protein [Pararhizobium antarcticum]OJF98461.1 hypothetical protein AX761_01615 [Rhizobium sp. 58]OJG01007.1 hypothetical protein AX760_09255 [Pararhizobium antarcticum]